jgi:DNA-binding ferritin-like protein (Dps family)
MTDKATAYVNEISDELFVSVSKEINEKMKDVGVNVKTLHIIIKYVMEAVEQSPIKGKSQKTFALRLIKELIDNMPDSDSDKKTLLNLYETDSISNTIELVVRASKGELGINQVGSCVWSCISACMKNV